MQFIKELDGFNIRSSVNVVYLTITQICFTVLYTIITFVSVNAALLFEIKLPSSRPANKPA